MLDLPQAIFDNPVWHALQTRHRHFVESDVEASGHERTAALRYARRYPRDVCPFAAIAVPTAAARLELHSLLAPGEHAWLIGEPGPDTADLACRDTLECLQMVLPPGAAAPSGRPPIEIVRLSAADAGAMVALTTLAFPGFFRVRTCEMGAYYGARLGDELIAMGGERLALDDFTEISGLCTHPGHRNNGLAAHIIWEIVRNHRLQGLVSWLQVGTKNTRAVDLYRRIGFEPVRSVTLHQVARAE